MAVPPQKHAVIKKVGHLVSDSAKMEARRRDSEIVKQAEKYNISTRNTELTGEKLNSAIKI